MSDGNRTGQSGSGARRSWSEDWPANQQSGAGRTPNWLGNASRRTFLKTALIGSAVAAAGGTATVVALKQAGASPLTTVKFNGGTGSPGSSKGAACTTDTGTSQNNTYTEKSTFPNSEEIYLWALFTNLPVAKYTITISPTIKAAGGAVCSTTSAPNPNPFAYSAGNGNASAARLYELSASAVTWDCSPPNQASLPSTILQGNSLESILSANNPYTLQTAGDDLQLQIRMKNGCDKGGTYVVTITLYQVVGNNTQQFGQPATTTITILDKHP